MPARWRYTNSAKLPSRPRTQSVARDSRAWPSIPTSASRIWRVSGCSASISAARDGRHDADFVTGLEHRSQTVEEANVLVADVDVHEAADALVVEQTLANARVILLQGLDHVLHGLAGSLNLIFAASEGAERGGDAHGSHIGLLVYG